jgi:hypothetical protein
VLNGLNAKSLDKATRPRVTLYLKLRVKQF